MGNCLPCINSKKSKNETAKGTNETCNVNIDVRHPVDREFYERNETDELLVQSPALITNINIAPDIHSGHVVGVPINAITQKNSSLLSNGHPNILNEALSTSGAKDHHHHHHNHHLQHINSNVQLQHHHHQTSLSDTKLLALYNEYKDDDDDQILSDGIERLCSDLGYKPDDFAILVLAWQLDASQMCRFTKSEFIQGMKTLNAETIIDVRLRLEHIMEKLKVDSELFKQLYRFTFRFGLEPDNRIVLLDMAILLWRLVFTVQTPPLLDRWLNYLEYHTNIRGVPKDTWNMFLNFAETCDITQYDDTEAWPSLFDDFVEYETDRANQNVGSSGEGGGNKNKEIIANERYNCNAGSSNGGSSAMASQTNNL